MSIPIRSCPELTEEAAVDFINNINEDHPVIDFSEEVKKVERILKNCFSL